MSTGTEYVTRTITAALNAVEDARPETAMQGMVAMVRLMIDPLSGCALAPMLGLMARVATELAEATGRTPAEVVAGWRQQVAQGLDWAEEMGDQWKRGS